MEIPPLKQSNTIKARIISDITKAWKVGQVLNGTTERGGNTASNVLIKIGQQMVEAKTPIPLKQGQEVKLLVKTAFDVSTNTTLTKLPILSILKTATLAPRENDIAGIKLRQFISVQQSFSQVQAIADTLTTDKKTHEKLPSPLKTLLTNLQSTLQVKTQNISATQLKQQILNSGIFLESKLIQQSTINTLSNTTNNSLSNDFKYQLLSIKSELMSLLPNKNMSNTSHQHVLQLTSLINQENTPLRNTQAIFLINKLISLLPKTSLTQISNFLNDSNSTSSIPKEINFLNKIIAFTFAQHIAPKVHEQINYQLMLLELSQLVEQAISKVTSLQLQPMSRDGDNMLLLLFNLVFKDSSERFDIGYRIQEVGEEQKNEKQNPDEKHWSVTLDFNFKTLGKVQSTIDLIGNKITSKFNTEHKKTAKKIQQLFPLLKSSFINAGLNITHLSVENTLTENKPHINYLMNLLDENI